MFWQPLGQFLFIHLLVLSLAPFLKVLTWAWRTLIAIFSDFESPADYCFILCIFDSWDWANRTWNWGTCICSTKYLKFYPRIYLDRLDLHKLRCSERNVVVVFDSYSMSTPRWVSCDQEIVNYALLLPYCSISIGYAHIGRAMYEDIYLTNVVSVLSNVSFFIDLGNCKSENWNAAPRQWSCR